MRLSKVVEDEIQRIIAHPRGALGRMEEMEVEAGRSLVRPGECKSFDFPASDWHYDCCVSQQGFEVRIVAIKAKQPGNGAFRRLISNIQRRGLKPIVVEPIGESMPVIMKRWGWKCTHVGKGFDHVELWRPISQSGYGG